ncbi:hypothetical protein [Acinetobacter sp. MD2(2019)]|uniref:hypothetical protein n=1 Tax=Acinetobacter sp. MD2(2019) TaxID=2605273 RepID=UPI002D1F81F6|nr:hypothetical protein [Acinetobacter sp. MD2(2019)]MEB3753825.1 hypothetical protein [Acinetobacter sp. MD2(2019)]
MKDMAAETDVQFFSHLNTLCPQLTNDWGCMIKLLDACLVNGVILPTITSASVEAGGNITVNFNAAHTCLLFQCVTLAGFSPSAMNGKYRIVGVPTTTQLTLSSNLSAQSAISVGTAKLSPLGYEIIFTANTKRVYRALNPTAQHPYIRVDESRASADGASVYNDSYAKYAMVGLLESMDDIDDVNDPNVLQLPFDPKDPDKNWTISGTGAGVTRGRAKWYWARSTNAYASGSDSSAPGSGVRKFTLCGNVKAFYLLNEMTPADSHKVLSGCGLYDATLSDLVVPSWFLMSILDTATNSNYDFSAGDVGGTPISSDKSIASKFYVPKCNSANPIQSNDVAYSIIPDGKTGKSAIYSANNIAALQIPFYDASKYLRGTLMHVYYAGNALTLTTSTPMLADSSMYVSDSIVIQSGQSGAGGCYFYLGEME